MEYFVGSNSKAEDAGIYRVKVENQKITQSTLLQALPFATWLDYDASRQQLLATRTGRDGHLFAFSYKDGELAALADAAAQRAACYICRKDQHIFVANYGTGTVSTYQLLDKKLTAGKIFEHKGSSVNEKRQGGPHAHQIVMSPDNKWALSCDLGCDAIYVYPFSDDKGLSDPQSFAVPHSGSGPRHLCFHPQKPIMYSLNELAGSLDVWDWQTKTGELKHVHHLDLPGTGASDIRQCGRFLYAGIRNNNTLAVIDMFHEREPQFIEAKALGGRPRGFSITDDEQAILVGNEREDALELYIRDQKTGLIGKRLDRIAMPAPVCVCSLKLGHRPAVYGKP